MNNYLILNIDCKNNSICIQVNKRDSDGICYNITFVNRHTHLVCDGFMVPTFSGNFNLPITGNSDTRALVHCLKVLPKVQENKIGLFEFIADLIKREKLTYWQLNINGNMDYRDATKITLSTLAEITKRLMELNFPICF